MSGGQRILLDTSAYAQFRRGQATVLDILVTAECVFLSTITLGELDAEFSLGARSGENRRTLRDFLDEPFVSVVAVDDVVAQQYGALFAVLRRAGTPMPTKDIWIASSALRVSAEVITFDTDFERLENPRARVLRA